MTATLLLDKSAIRQSFAMAADSYDRVAALQRQVGEHLYAGLSRQWLSQADVLDIGCGTGFMSAKLVSECQSLLALDIAFPMLQKTRAALAGRGVVDYLCADAETLPLADNSIDFIVANLSLQWCQNLAGVFAEFQRVLTANGRLAFSTFGSDTLIELKDAWAGVDDFTHVNSFYSGEDIRRALCMNGFDAIKISGEQRVSRYNQVQELMRELKGIGAHNVNRGRIATLTGKRRMAAMIDQYERRRFEGLLPATFEIIYVQASVGL